MPFSYLYTYPNNLSIYVFTGLTEIQTLILACVATVIPLFLGLLLILGVRWVKRVLFTVILLPEKKNQYLNFIVLFSLTVFSHFFRMVWKKYKNHNTSNGYDNNGLRREDSCDAVKSSSFMQSAEEVPKRYNFARFVNRFV